MQRTSFLLLSLHRQARPLVGLRPAMRLVIPDRLWSSSSVTSFDEHVRLVKGLSTDPGNEDKLQLYALFKQATEGPNTKSKPGALDFVGKYKWQAWADLGQMSKTEAQAAYVKKVQQLIKSIGLQEGQADSAFGSVQSGVSDTEAIVVTVEHSIKTIRFNRPAKKNAFTPDMYFKITDEINQASKDKQIKAIILTGTGDFYSSGNDLGLFLKAGGDVKALADQACETMIRFVDAFIDCEKPIIAAVNGHAVGILVTTLGLCDTVIATDQATFLTPFGSTAQVPEGGSTYTFPRLLGTSVATQMLLFNQKLTAQQALTHGLIGTVVPQAEFEAYLQQFKQNIDQNCAMHSLVWGKKLLRPEYIKQEQRKANREEAALLKKAWFTPEFPQFIGKFFQRKK